MVDEPIYGCNNDYGKECNSYHICPICNAQPHQVLKINHFPIKKNIEGVCAGLCHCLLKVSSIFFKFISSFQPYRFFFCLNLCHEKVG